MSDEKEMLPVKVESFLALAKVEKVREVIKTNFGEAGISIWDLERIKIPAGGGMSWQVLSPTGDVTEKKVVTALMPHKREERNFWKEEFGQGASKPPDCYSSNMVTGNGDNGTGEIGEHDCLTCPQNQWGSNSKGEGKACRQNIVAFLLPQGKEDHIFPTILTITPGSLKAAKGYFTDLSSRLLSYQQVVHTITLEKAQNNQKIAYARVKWQIASELTEDDIAKLIQYAETMRASFSSVRVTSDESA
jgi:hypothetical protein